MAAKIFAVGDVLPATTQLKISWVNDISNRENDNVYIISTTYNYTGIEIYQYHSEVGTISFYISVKGVNKYADEASTIPAGYHVIDISSLSESERTVIRNDYWDVFYWEDLNAPSGYTITFNSNGGTTISDIEEATELPTPLPTPTKSGYKFVAWYYESNFQTRAKAGDTIEVNTTLYAKWHNLGTLFTGIANAIRSKDGTSGNIRDLDFDDRIRAIEPAKEEETKTVTPNFSSGNQVIEPTSGKVLSQVTLTKPTDLLPENIAKDKNVCGVVGTSFIAIELTQAEYDALETKDANTYYLIVEE
jgi:uncharacterized repeat protein (TIGR02543 family)